MTAICFPEGLVTLYTIIVVLTPKIIWWEMNLMSEDMKEINHYQTKQYRKIQHCPNLIINF